MQIIICQFIYVVNKLVKLNILLILCLARDFPPHANAGKDISITLPEKSVRLYGNGSTDDYGITQYEWVLKTNLPADMQGARSSILYANNMVEGTYTFQLIVTDTKNQKDRDDVNVIVNPGNWIIAIMY